MESWCQDIQANIECYRMGLKSRLRWKELLFRTTRKHFKRSETFVDVIRLKLRFAFERITGLRRVKVERVISN